MIRTALLLFLCAAVLPAQDNQAKVDRIFDRIEETRGVSLWEGIREIEELGRGSLNDVRRGVSRADGFVRIAAARVLYANESRAEALEVLSKVVAGKHPGARKAAADMTASLLVSDKGLTEVDRSRVAVDLRAQAQAAEDPLTQVALWRALWGATAGGMEAVRELRKMHDKAERREVKEESALALAEMDRFIWAKATLTEMAQEPSDRGRLARSYLKLNTLTEAAGNNPAGARASKYDFKALEETIDLLRNWYYDETKVLPEKLIEAAARGAASSLDPYTVYMDEASIRQLREEDLRGEYGGIGARVKLLKDKAGFSWLTIEEPIFSGPAYRAGLRSNDTIVEVEGEDTRNKELGDLVRKLRGKPATPVKIKVSRRGWTKIRDFEITRERIHMETTAFRMLPGAIGYIKLTTFGEKDDVQVEKAVRALEGMKALVFDLRGNSGGYLRTAHRIANCFLDKGQSVVSTRGRTAPSEDRLAEGGKVTDVPIVMLVDGGSASASEILAGALQDHKRALLVGEKTFGKGSVQDLKYLKTAAEKTAIKVTISKWYLPSGRTVEADKPEESGVKPDVKIAEPEREFWKLNEFDRLIAGDEILKYVKEIEDRPLFLRLAESDGGDLSRYPRFDALYQSLETKASKDEIRELVRQQIRKHVQDEYLKKPLYADMQTDTVLQRGIIEACKMGHVDAKGIKEYSTFAFAPETKQD